jgi:hypothetical protein
MVLGGFMIAVGRLGGELGGGCRKRQGQQWRVSGINAWCGWVLGAVEAVKKRASSQKGKEQQTQLVLALLN